MTTTQLEPVVAEQIAKDAFGPTARVKEITGSTDPATRFRVAFVPDGTTSPLVIGYGATGYAEALQRAFISPRGQQLVAELKSASMVLYQTVNDDPNADLESVCCGDFLFEYPAGTKPAWLASHSETATIHQPVSSSTTVIPNALTATFAPPAPVPVDMSVTVQVVTPTAPKTKVSIPRAYVNPSTIKTGLMGWDDDVTPAAVLAAITGEHLLVVGPPGAAKSLFVRRLFAHFEGTLFETQLSKYADETALFGAPNLKLLRDEGVFQYPKHGIAANDWGFIDEIFDASDVLLRTLLAILQEKKFTKGGHEEDIPLQSVIATANYTRVNEITSAVVDRFAFTVTSPVLTAVQRERLYSPESFEDVPRVTNVVGLEQLKQMRAKSKTVTIPPSIITSLVSWAGEMGFTPRRERKLASIIRASAALAGRSKVDENDIMAARYCVPISNSGAVENASKSLQPLKDAILQSLHEGEQLAQLGKMATPVSVSTTATPGEIIAAIRATKPKIVELRAFTCVSEKVNERREAAVKLHDDHMTALHARLDI